VNTITFGSRRIQLPFCASALPLTPPATSLRWRSLPLARIYTAAQRTRLTHPSAIHYSSALLQRVLERWVVPYMHVLSPYGKDTNRELQSVYGLASAEHAAQFIVRHVQQHYGLANVTVESLHIAYGLVAKLASDGTPYYLKFASHSMHRHPDQLFPWLAHVRQRGLPVPAILRSQDGAWFLAPLPRSTYNVVYLMHACPGTPLQSVDEHAVLRYVEMMARFHQLGTQYVQPVDGSVATWTSKWAERDRVLGTLAVAPGVSPDVVARAMALIEQTGPRRLSSSIIHGDFRLCHVLFSRDQLTGIIDVDQSTTGERWVDLCYGLLSGATPEAGALLPFPVVRRALEHYDQHYPLSDAERAMLKATFAYATLETLHDLVPGVSAGTATAHDLTVTQDLFDAIYATPDDELLAAR